MCIYSMWRIIYRMRTKRWYEGEGTGAADDLELVGWLCERIWVLQGNFMDEDGYAAARVSIAEMLKSGTTCFLESMISFVRPLSPPRLLILGVKMIFCSCFNSHTS
jgi:cytosine/adenosine deaminase-related metal-dependent hydrolase